MKLSFREPTKDKAIATMNYFSDDTTKQDILDFGKEHGLDPYDFYFTTIDDCDYCCEGSLDDIATYLDIANRYQSDYENIRYAYILKDTELIDAFDDYIDLLKAVCNEEFIITDLFGGYNFDTIPDDLIEWMSACVSLPKSIRNILTDREIVKAVIEGEGYWNVDYDNKIAWMSRWNVH